MTTRRMMRGLSLVGALLLTGTLVILATTIVSADPAGTPTVDGRFYGGNDSANYNLLAEAPAGRGKLYYHQNGTTLYVAMVVSTSVNDNVFDDIGTASGRTYVQSADWSGGGGGQGKQHTAGTLIQSDHIELSLSCGQNSYTWKQDYAYDSNGNEDPNEADWLSDDAGGDGTGAGTAPPNTVSKSSFQWNMNNNSSSSGWDVTLNNTRTGPDTWKSVDGDSDNDVTDEQYPQYNTTYGWEWPMVYEMSLDVTNCSDSWEIDVLSAHNSPSKDNEEDVVVELGKITIVKETYDQSGNLTQHYQDFAFTSDLGGFTLDTDPSSDPPPDRKTFRNLEAGTYVFTEILPSDQWELFDVTCTDDDSGLVVGTTSASINLAANEEVTCTFKNDPGGGTTSVDVTSVSASKPSGLAVVLGLVVTSLVAVASGSLWTRRRST